MKKSVRKDGGIKIKQSVNMSSTFVIALSIFSIVGFIAIILSSFFEVDISDYIDSLLLLVMGIALVVEGRIKQLTVNIRKDLSSNDFAHIVTAVIGVMAIIAGIFSIPQIRIEHHVFLAVKGILSVIAIIVIVVETWVIG